MITQVVIKSNIPQLGRRNTFARSAGWSFAVQSGMLVLREPGGAVHSVPLADVAYCAGCPAAPPKAVSDE
jgi:hypothetical protein